MLRVNYKDEFGFIWLLANDQKTYLKVAIHSANCLFALIYHYKKTNAETGKKEGYSQLYMWFNDIKHLAVCLGLKTYRKDQVKESMWQPKDIKKIKLNTYFKGMARVGELFAKAGFKVELYYKPKKSKGGK